MSAKDFKFVSPGVFIEEIDNSQLPQLPEDIGPLVIGRARRGPAMQPVRVDSFSEFVTIFGNPVGGEEASDQWRYGIPSAPTFAAYAAQAWLRNNSPLTFIRLLGEQSPNAQDTNDAKAGWKFQNKQSTDASGGGAYGLFLFNSASTEIEAVDGTLAAIFYSTTGAPVLSGSIRGFDGTFGSANLLQIGGMTATASATLIEGAGTGVASNWTINILNSNETALKSTTFSFDRTAPNYIRKVFNTNPTKTNSELVNTAVNPAETLFLGQTYERQIMNTVTSSNAYGVILSLGKSGAGVTDGGDFKFAAQKGRTGWFFSQDLRNTAANTTDITANEQDPPFNPEDNSTVTRLFKLHGLSSGGDLQKNFKISIEDVKYSKNDNVPYGTFTLAIRSIRDTDNARKYVERFTNLNLDPNSEMYISKQIGDRYYEWDNNSKRLIEYGSYPNRSKVIRVEMSDTVESNQHDPECLPFGVEGPTSLSDFTVESHEDAVGATSAADAFSFGGAPDNNDTFTITIPGSYGTDAGKTFSIIFLTSISGTPGANEIFVLRDTSTPAAMNDNFQKVFNGDTDTTKVKFGSNVAGATAGVSTVGIGSISAEDGSDTAKTTLTADIKGVIGNGITMADGGGTTAMSNGTYDFSTFSGGAVEGNTANGRISTTSPITAGSGSSGVFAAHSGSSTGSPAGRGVIVESLKRGSEGSIPFTGSVSFPSVALRVSASDGDLSDDTEAYFGATTSRSGSNNIFEESVFDIAYPLPSGLHQQYEASANNAKVSWYFSLDDLVADYKTVASNRDVVHYASGSRASGYSMTAISGSYKKILDIGYDRFTTVFFNGFDGFDITEKEPFNATRALKHGESTETSHAMFYTVKKAVDMFSDPEYIESNLLLSPGIVNEGITNHMILTAEERGDALAIIDPRGGYEPASENFKTEQERMVSGIGVGSVSQHVVKVGENMELRNLNSSYGATYYPWVRIRDTISGRSLWAPPSIAAIGALSFSEKAAALWFAPAGFNRGGLSDGAAGIPVTNIRQRLTSAERDYLYERNINPIASFPNEGIVIFGQKTLQVTPSALDRINVRRLMIFVKKEISRIASRLLFDQNVESTWARFTGQVEPFLSNIKNNFGLDDFKVVLDNTTTTPDLIDRNTIYAKIFLKPTKAVEFFAIDFVITNSGAGFED